MNLLVSQSPTNRATTEGLTGRDTVLAGAGAAAFFAGQQCVGVVNVPESLLLGAALAVVATAGIGAAADRITQWWDEHRHPAAVDIPEEELDPAALALVYRIRQERRAREVV